MVKVLLTLSARIVAALDKVVEGEVWGTRQALIRYIVAQYLLDNHWLE